MNTGPEIKVGMCMAIEPMLNQGSDKIITKEDGWTIVHQMVNCQHILNIQ